MNRYTLGFKQKVLNADQEKVGVQYAIKFIEEGISVETVANNVGMSRMTIYNWFVGRTSPNEKQVAQLEELLQEHTKE